MRENSWRQQLRKLRLKHSKNDTHPKTTADRVKTCKRGMSTENNIGVSDKSHGTMGRQRSKPRQMQKAMDQATILQ